MRNDTSTSSASRNSHLLFPRLLQFFCKTVTQLQRTQHLHCNEEHQLIRTHGFKSRGREDTVSEDYSHGRRDFFRTQDRMRLIHTPAASRPRDEPNISHGSVNQTARSRFSKNTTNENLEIFGLIFRRSVWCHWHGLVFVIGIRVASLAKFFNSFTFSPRARDPNYGDMVLMRDSTFELWRTNGSSLNTWAWQFPHVSHHSYYESYL